MEDRFLAILPALIAGLAITSAIGFYQLTHRTELNDVRYLTNNPQYLGVAKQNHGRYILLGCVRMSLIFLAPLIVFFGSLSLTAWYGMVASSLAFTALMSFKIKAPEELVQMAVAREIKSGQNRAATLSEARDVVRQRFQALPSISSAIKVIAIFDFTSALLLSIVSVYFGSLWITYVSFFFVSPIVALAFKALSFPIVFTASLLTGKKGRIHRKVDETMTTLDHLFNQPQTTEK